MTESLPESNNLLVLVTGVNGYIASWTAKAFLDAGYNVRGTSRKPESCKPLIEGPLSAYADSGRFTVVTVADITVDGAFDDAVKDVHAIAHMAAPVSQFFTDPGPVLRAATLGTQCALHSALASPTMKHFVLISSIAAIADGVHAAPYTYTEADWNDHSGSEVSRLGPKSPGGQIYRASKAAAERALWNFREDHNPPFTITAVNPVYVSGPPLVLPADPARLNETVLSIWQILRGDDWKDNFLGGMGARCHVRDVARLMLFAVAHPERADGERFIVCAGLGNEQAMADILFRAYPARRGIMKRGVPGLGYLEGYGFPEHGVRVDAGKGVRVTGWEWVGYERVVLETARAFEAYL